MRVDWPDDSGGTVGDPRSAPVRSWIAATRPSGRTRQLTDRHRMSNHHTTATSAWSSTDRTSRPRGGRSRAWPSSTTRSPPSPRSTPTAVITVVVDATFGHRIDKSEVDGVRRGGGPQRARRAAGRRHRPRRRVRAQHRQQGRRHDPQQRLVPGVPRRVPVAVRRGPPDRRQARAVRRLGVRRPPAGEGPDQPQVARAGGGRGGGEAPAGCAAGQPGGEPADAGAESRRPAGARRPRSSRPRTTRRPGAVEAQPVAPPAPAPARGAPPAPASGIDGAVNDLLPFLDFVEHHPVGSSVNGVVESYSSHGAYVTVGDLRGYVPLRLMANPPPRSAREVMQARRRGHARRASASPRPAAASTWPCRRWRRRAEVVAGRASSTSSPRRGQAHPAAKKAAAPAAEAAATGRRRAVAAEPAADAGPTPRARHAAAAVDAPQRTPRRSTPADPWPQTAGPAKRGRASAKKAAAADARAGRRSTRRRRPRRASAARAARRRRRPPEPVVVGRRPPKPAKAAARRRPRQPSRRRRRRRPEPAAPARPGQARRPRRRRPRSPRPSRRSRPARRDAADEAPAPDAGEARPAKRLAPEGAGRSADALRDLERQLAQGPPGARRAVAGRRRSPTSCACRRPSSPTSAFPALAFEALGYDVGAPRRGPLERRGDPVARRARRRRSSASPTATSPTPRPG